jgi:hypothetical protein
MELRGVVVVYPYGLAVPTRIVSGVLPVEPQQGDSTPIGDSYGLH